jgi:hypothetical protein
MLPSAPSEDYEMTLPPTSFTTDLSNYFQNDHEIVLEATDLNSNLEWLFNMPSQDDVPDLNDLFAPGDSSSLNGSARNLPVGWPNDQGLSLSADPISRETSVALEREPAILRLPSPQAEEDCSPDDPWPMEWHAEPLLHSSELTALGSDEDDGTNDYARSFSTWTLRSSTIGAMKYYLKLPERRSPWPPISLDKFPGKEKLGYCIDRYFVHFHPVSCLVAIIVGHV